MSLVDARTAQWVESPSGLIVPEDCIAPRRTAIDLFCGVGGFSLGIIGAGFEVLLAADHWEVAAITYMHNLGSYPSQFWFVDPSDGARLEKALTLEAKRKNKDGVTVAITTGGARPRGRDPWSTGFPNDRLSPEERAGWPDGYKGVPNFLLGNIRNVTGRQILDILGMERGDLDLIVGGPPCQGFSHAGKRNVLDPRNSLVFEFARLVCEIQPKAMCMEEVPGILSMVTSEGLNVVDELCRILERGEFAEYDAARKMLAGDSSRRMVRGKRKAPTPGPEPEHATQPEPTPSSAQTALFGAGR